MIAPTYLITKDIVETLERKFGYPLTSELRAELRTLERKFLRVFFNLLPNEINNVSLDASFVSDQITEYVRARNVPVVSLDRVYLPDANDYLEVTRVTNRESGEVRIAERSGKLKLEEQLERLGAQYGRICLVDVGAFEGKTILDLCEMLNTAGVSVEEICLGISGKEAKEKIEQRFRLKTFSTFNFYEWIELRDLFGIDGRNVGFENGKRLIMPYWENICKWASVPEEKRRFAENLCRKFNREIIGRLWQEGYDLTKLGVPVRYLGVK